MICHIEPPAHGDEYHNESSGPLRLAIASAIPSSDAKSVSAVMGTTLHPLDHRVALDNFELGSQQASTNVRLELDLGEEPAVEPAPPQGTPL